MDSEFPPLGPNPEFPTLAEPTSPPCKDPESRRFPLLGPECRNNPGPGAESRDFPVLGGENRVSPRSRVFPVLGAESRNPGPRGGREPIPPP